MIMKELAFRLIDHDVKDLKTLSTAVLQSEGLKVKYAYPLGNFIFYFMFNSVLRLKNHNFFP